MPADLHVALVSPHPVRPATSGDKVRTTELLSNFPAVDVDGSLVTYDWEVGREVVRDDEGVRVGGRPRGGLALLTWRVALRLQRRANPYALFDLDGARDRMRAALAGLPVQVEDYQHSFVWQPSSRPTVCTFHNIESDPDKERRAGGTKQLRALSAMERRAAQGCDVAVVFSREDQERLTRLAPDSVVRVVPLGYRPRRHSRQEIRSELTTVAFVGSFSYGPNVEAARELVRIAPQLAAVGVRRVKIIGSQASSHVTPSGVVEVHSDVEDVGEALADVDVLLVPLRHGGGVRVKVIEALAMGLPVISTHVGVEGLEFVDGLHGSVVEGADDMAEAVRRMHAPDIREQYSAAGRELWASTYSPAHMAASMKDVYEHAIAVASRRGSAA